MKIGLFIVISIIISLQDIVISKDIETKLELVQIVSIQITSNLTLF
jgi:hypothetical protein